MLKVDIRSAGYTDETTIRSISFSIANGELVALIGANGAGKSTTIKAILGLLPYMEGTISVGNYAYVPEQPIYYDYLTVWEHIQLLATAKELGAGWEEEAQELLQIFRMDKHIHEYLSTFSKGMKQKTMLILAFLAKPDFYIVDEPFLGLDPNATRDFLAVLEKERARGAGVLLCTHVLDTAERISERFILISDGYVVADGSLQDLQKLAAKENEPLVECFAAIVGGA